MAVWHNHNHFNTESKTDDVFNITSISVCIIIIRYNLSESAHAFEIRTWLCGEVLYLYLPVYKTVVVPTGSRGGKTLSLLNFVRT